MKKSIILFLSFLFLLTNLTLAQATEEDVNDNGIYIGASLVGAEWIPEIGSYAESGTGIGLKLGYNFNTNFAIFASVDGASIEPDQRDSFALVHLDLGFEGRIGSSSSRIRPFLRATWLIMSAYSVMGDYEINGIGMSLGGGLYYFATNHLALEVGYKRSMVDIGEIKVRSFQVYDAEGDAQTGRFELGISYHF